MVDTVCVKEHIYLEGSEYVLERGMEFLSLSLCLKHILSLCERSQKCIFHALYASAIPQTDHF